MSFLVFFKEWQQKFENDLFIYRIALHATLELLHLTCFYLRDSFAAMPVIEERTRWYVGFQRTL